MCRFSLDKRKGHLNVSEIRFLGLPQGQAGPALVAPVLMILTRILTNERNLGKE